MNIRKAKKVLGAVIKYERADRGRFAIFHDMAPVGGAVFKIIRGGLQAQGIITRKGNVRWLQRSYWVKDL